MRKENRRNSDFWVRANFSAVTPNSIAKPITDAESKPSFISASPTQRIITTKVQGSEAISKYPSLRVQEDDFEIIERSTKYRKIVSQDNSDLVFSPSGIGSSIGNLYINSTNKEDSIMIDEKDPCSYPSQPTPPYVQFDQCDDVNNSEILLEGFKYLPMLEQNIFLRRLIDLCNSNQHRLISSCLSHQLRRDFISQLPVEVTTRIFSFLDVSSCIRSSSVCKRWRNIIQSDISLWLNLCRSYRFKIHRSLIENVKEERDDEECKGPSMRLKKIKKYFSECYLKDLNWEKGRYSEINFLAHENYVVTCMEVRSNLVFTGSDDGTVKIWDIATGRLKKSLVGHTGGVWTMDIRDNLIATGATDRTVKVWDITTGACKFDYHGHSNTVRCLKIFPDMERLVSGSRDSTLKIWNLKGSKPLLLMTLTGHTDSVRCLDIQGDFIFSGSYDTSCRIWDSRNGACLSVLSGHTNKIYSIASTPEYVISGSMDADIRVWDIQTGTCKHVLRGHNSLVAMIQVQRKDDQASDDSDSDSESSLQLLSGSADHDLRLWNLQDGTCSAILQGHKCAITCIDFGSRRIASGSEDGLFLWPLSSLDSTSKSNGISTPTARSVISGAELDIIWKLYQTEDYLVIAYQKDECTRIRVLNFSPTITETN